MPWQSASKAYGPIEVTDDGIMISVKYEQLMKAASPIEVMDDGITILFILL